MTEPSKDWRPVETDAVDGYRYYEVFDQQHSAMIQFSAALAGICFAGLIYPLVVLGSVALYSINESGWPSYISLGDVIGLGAMLALAGATIGLVVSAFASVFSLLVLSLANRSFGKPLTPWTIGICTGSLAGYIPTSWIGFAALENSNAFESMAAILLGPILAMTCGIVGAAWQMSTLEFDPIDHRNDQFATRFSIKHLLAATTWIAVILAITNFAGGPKFPITIVAWIFLHLALTMILTLLYRLWRPKND